jgi:hypothetical protein
MIKKIVTVLNIACFFLCCLWSWCYLFKHFFIPTKPILSHPGSPSSLYKPCLVMRRGDSNTFWRGGNIFRRNGDEGGRLWDWEELCLVGWSWSNNYRQFLFLLALCIHCPQPNTIVCSPCPQPNWIGPTTVQTVQNQVDIFINEQWKRKCQTC